MSTQDLLVLLPETFLVAWAALLLLVDLKIDAGRKGWTAFLTAAGFTVALGLHLASFGHTASAFSGMVVVDPFAAFLGALLAFVGLLAVALAYEYLTRHGLQRGEYYILLLFAVAGMSLMTKATDLVVVFLALELLSLPLYVLAGFARPRLDSEEAAIKYFLLGAFAAGFFVYGVALVYGATGTTQLTTLVGTVNAGHADLTLLAAGVGLLLVGLGFKVAAVPFHMWTPDVYQGAPTPVTGFMAVGAKVAGIAALLRWLAMAFPVLSERVTPVLWALAALTMVWGNVLAIAQRNIKRMLAYSSIAHAGYLLMALVPFGHPVLVGEASQSVLFYLVAYALTNLGAWAVVAALEREAGRGLTLEDYAGLGRKHPALAAAMAVFMLSLTGMPPTVGFVGKFYLFRVVVESGYVGLAVIGVLTSLISAYYYLRVLVYMYMREGDPQTQRAPWLGLTWGSMAVLVLLLGMMATPLAYWAARAALHL